MYVCDVKKGVKMVKNGKHERKEKEKHRTKQKTK